MNFSPRVALDYPRGNPVLANCIEHLIVEININGYYTNELMPESEREQRKRLLIVNNVYADYPLFDEIMEDIERCHDSPNLKKITSQIVSF